MTELDMKAHQYLYYVEGAQVLSDREYDRLCCEAGLFGGGGSDSASHYTEEEKQRASELKKEK